MDKLSHELRVKYDANQIIVGKWLENNRMALGSKEYEALRELIATVSRLRKHRNRLRGERNVLQCNRESDQDTVNEALAALEARGQ